jgi:hypothetical protein
MADEIALSPEITWTEGACTYGACPDGETYILARMETMRYQISGKVIAKSWIRVEWHFHTVEACRHHAYVVELGKTKVQNPPKEYKAFQVVGHPWKQRAIKQMPRGKGA